MLYYIDIGSLCILIGGEDSELALPTSMILFKLFLTVGERWSTPL